MHWSILSDQRKQSFKSFKQHRQRLDDLSKYLVGFENFFWFEKWSEISLKEWRPFKLPKNVVLVDEKRLFKLPKNVVLVSVKSLFKLPKNVVLVDEKSLFKLPKNRSSIVFGYRNRFGHSLVPAFRFLNSFKLRADSISSTLQLKVVAASFFQNDRLRTLQSPLSCSQSVAWTWWTILVKLHRTKSRISSLWCFFLFLVQCSG